jgi:hypothetical protein
MIILDFSGIMHSNIARQVGFNNDVTVDEGLIRHMILNSIRSNNAKFRNEFGEMVLAFDYVGPSWRRDVYPYYKAARAVARKESPLDWKMINDTMRLVQDEIREFLPYRVIQTERAEADDVIAVLARKVSETEKVLILSRDGDFLQLQTDFGGQITQFDPIGKEPMVCPNPERAKVEKIVRGDSGDGVPNVYMKDDFFVTRAKGERQTTITKKRLDMLCAELPCGVGEEYLLRNYARNRELIDLDETPADIQQSIWKDFSGQTPRGRGRLLNYFASKRLRALCADISDF